MTGLFHQKQRELLMAAARVEELSDQLEALRSYRLDPHLPHHHPNSSSAAELERLYRELQVRLSHNSCPLELSCQKDPDDYMKQKITFKTDLEKSWNDFERRWCLKNSKVN